MNVGNPYEILGVSYQASPQEIREAYLKKVKENHPDTHPDNPEAEERVKRINLAYEMLTSRSKRTLGEVFGFEGIFHEMFDISTAFDDLIKHGTGQQRVTETTLILKHRHTAEVLKNGCTRILTRNGATLEYQIPPNSQMGDTIVISNGLQVTDGVKGDIKIRLV